MSARSLLVRELVAQGAGLADAELAAGTRAVIHEWTVAPGKVMRASLNTIGERPIASLRLYARDTGGRFRPTTNALSIDAAQVGHLEDAVRKLRAVIRNQGAR